MCVWRTPCPVNPEPARGNRDGRRDNLSTGAAPLARPYSFRAWFDNEKGANSEELIAAAHAGCFFTTLAFVLHGAGYTPTELDVEAAASIKPEVRGFRISRSVLTLCAQVSNLDEAMFARMVGDVEKNRPVSKVLNAVITLEAKLIAARHLAESD
jgi:osmotically inducible protein OsmC